jgi:hypothetical protein
MTEETNEHNTNQKGVKAPGFRKIHDLWSARIIGIMSGACIPLLLILIPVVNRYLDDSKELAKYLIEKGCNDSKDIRENLTNCQSINRSLSTQNLELHGELSKCLIKARVS